MSSRCYALPVALLLAAALLAPASLLPAAARSAPAATALPAAPTPFSTDFAPAPVAADTRPSLAAGSTIEIPIAAGSDDAGPNPDSAYPQLYGCAYSTSWNEVYFGQCRTGADITSGFRFASVPVPAGAHILDAYLRFTVDGTYVTEYFTAHFHGEAAGNAATFSETSRPEDRPLIAEPYAEWRVQAGEVWTLGETRQSPPLTGVVQAIIDRPDWHAGNAMAIIVVNAGPAGGTQRHRRVIGYERPYWYAGSAYAARLVIRYEIAPPTPTPTPTPTPDLTSGTIAGTVWHDLDRDGARDAGEPGLPGVRICAAPLGHLAPLCTSTAADGGYRLTALAPRTYLLAAEPPAGMAPTTRGFYLPVALRPGQQLLDADFGYR